MLPLAKSVDEQYADAFWRWRLNVDDGTEVEVLARLRQEPEPVRRQVAAALDAWMLWRRQQKQAEERGGGLARLGGRLDGGQRRRQLREVPLGEQKATAAGVAGLVGVAAPWPALWELGRGLRWRHLGELRGGMRVEEEPVLTVLLLARACAAVGDVA